LTEKNFPGYNVGFNERTRTPSYPPFLWGGYRENILRYSVNLSQRISQVWSDGAINIAGAINTTGFFRCNFDHLKKTFPIFYFFLAQFIAFLQVEIKTHFEK
jgi:hypothetical protein